MALFLGKFPYLLDEKGRINIPSKFRDLILLDGDPNVGTLKGMDGCIAIYPLKTLQRFLENFDRTQFKSEAEARRLQRIFADGGSVSQPDAQGRITLTPEQRDYAGLKRDVIIFGNIDHIEVWDPERLKAHLALEGDGAEAVSELAGRFFK